jgi:hypothetical protein
MAFKASTVPRRVLADMMCGEKSSRQDLPRDIGTA